MLRLSLVLCLVSSTSWARLVSERHDAVRAVSEPDEPEFSRTSLANAFEARLAVRNRVTNGQPGEPGGPGRPGERGEPGRPTQAAPPPRVQNPFSSPPKCDRNAIFRTINGTCNNLGRPFQGASKIPLARLVRNTYEDGINSPTATYFVSNGKLPTARNVSLNIHITTSNISDRHSHLMMNFAQFTDHDITLSPEAEGPKRECCGLREDQWVGRFRDCFPLFTPRDPIFRTTTCIPFLRSTPTVGFSNEMERFQTNDLTAYLDASQVYGSTNIKARSLRTFSRGKLRASRGLYGEERLPLSKENPANCFGGGDEECTFLGGDVRSSEQAALTSVHTLLLRDHNRIACGLLRHNYYLSDEEIYQKTRRIIGAMMQRITYREFLPEVLGPEIMRKYDLTLLDSGRFRRYSSNVDASIVTEFSSAAFRFGHSMVRQSFTASRYNSVDLKDIFSSFKTLARFGSDCLLGGLASDRMEVRDRMVTAGLRDGLFGMELDLAAFNIQRARDHGVGSYMNIRRRLGLRTFSFFRDMVGVTHSQESVDALNKVYPRPGDIEAFSGGISEIPLKDAIVGEMFANIIGYQFRKIRFGDRFWHETDDPTTKLTDGQLAEIRKASLAGLYCQNVKYAVVRKYLLVAEIPGNPTVDCRTIPTIDLSQWAN